MSADSPPTPPAAIVEPAPADATRHRVIGQATMQPNGIIAMQLRIEDPVSGAVGHAYPRYAPGDPEYQKVLDHLGPFKPGETKPVLDDWN